MDLVLIRHARPEVRQGVCYGCLDLPLADPMSPPAPAIAGAVRDFTPTRLIASPLVRARDTALALGLPLAIEIEPCLREIDFGSWEGCAWDDIPRADLDAWAADLMAARPHGGESAAQAFARVTQWADALRDGSQGCLCVVAHAGPIRMLAAHWLGVPLARTVDWELGFGASCLFRVDATGARLGWWNRAAGG